jgi:hypothetical protein
MKQPKPGPSVFTMLGLRALALPSLSDGGWRSIPSPELRRLLLCIDDLADAELDASALVQHVHRLIRARDELAAVHGERIIDPGKRDTK